MKYLEKIVTKELLRNVLPKEMENLSEDFSFYIDDDYIVFRDDGEQIFDYNIYKFAHKCKEWAIKYSSWTLQSYTNERGSGICRIKVGDGQEINKLIALSEPAAIFKACEWIQEEIK